MTVSVQRCLGRALVALLLLGVVGTLGFLGTNSGIAAPLLAQALQPPPAAVPQGASGEASLVLPDLSTVDFLGVNGRTLLMGGLVVCALGLLFGLATFT